MPNPSKVVPGANKVIPDPNRVITKVEVTAYSVGQGMGHTIAAYNANNHLIHFAIADLGSSSDSGELTQTIQEINSQISDNNSLLDTVGNLQHRVIDAIFISHNDSDHHNGLTSNTSLLNLKARNIYVGGKGREHTQKCDDIIRNGSDSDHFSWYKNGTPEKYLVNLEKYLFEKPLPLPKNSVTFFSLNHMESKPTLTLGAGEEKLRFYVLFANCSTESNDSSLLLYVTFNRHGYLFTGDATNITFDSFSEKMKLKNTATKVEFKTEISEIINNSPCFFMSVPHHGAAETSADNSKTLKLTKVSSYPNQYYINKLQELNATLDTNNKELFKKHVDEQSRYRLKTLRSENEIWEHKTPLDEAIRYLSECKPNDAILGKRVFEATDLFVYEARSKPQPLVLPQPKRKSNNQVAFSIRNNETFKKLRIFSDFFKPKAIHASAGICSTHGHPAWSAVAAIHDVMAEYNFNLNETHVVMYDHYKRDVESEGPYSSHWLDRWNKTRPSINNKAFHTNFKDKDNPNLDTDSKIEVSNVAKFFYIGNFIHNDSFKNIFTSVINVENVSGEIEIGQDSIKGISGQKMRELGLTSTPYGVFHEAAGNETYQTCNWTFIIDSRNMQTLSIRKGAERIHPNDALEAFSLNEASTLVSIYIGEKPTD